MSVTNYTEEMVAKIEILWLDGKPTREICETVGITSHSFEFRRLPGGCLDHLPKRQQGINGGRSKDARDPSLIEIWGPGGLTEQVRSGWTPIEFYQRRNGYIPG